MVLPASAHAAFEKGAAYFGVTSVRVPVRDDWRADPAAMAAAVDADTALVVASAPQYPQGVVDPVEEVAAIAAERGISCHVDACMGGVTLPHLELLGYPVAPWDFRVEGVTSISVDLHKLGYTAKGASVILHRSKDLRRYQTFVTDNWLGGLYGSSGVLGTKSGGAIAAAWAVLHHLGTEGYLRLTAAARGATEQLAAGIAGLDELVLRAEPDTTLLAFGAADPEALDVFAVADALWRRGWYVDRQGPPPSLHCTVNAVHAERRPGRSEPRRGLPRRPPRVRGRGGGRGWPRPGGGLRHGRVSGSYTPAMSSRLPHSLPTVASLEGLADAARPTVKIDHPHAKLTHSQVGSELAGWFSFQPMFDWIVDKEPDLLD